MKLPAGHGDIKTCVLKFHEDKNLELKDELARKIVKGERFSCTTDEWTNISSKRYMNINIHGSNSYVSNLGLARISGCFSAERALETATERLNSFGLENEPHIVAFTADGAAVMKKFGSLSQSEYQGCYSHALHLAVCDVLYKESEVITETIPDDCEDDSDQEETEETFAIVTEAVRELSLKEDIAVAIKNVRKDVKFFRKSPKSNEFLQENIKKVCGKELKLILDVRTRWNSLYEMLERYVQVRMCVVKTLTDLSKTSSVSDEECSLCKSLCNILEPVKLTSDSLCRNDANLITADAAINFLIDTLATETGCNNIHAQIMKDSVIKRISERRNLVLVHLMKYLVNGDFSQVADQITGTKVTKSSIHTKANLMFTKLFGQEDTAGNEGPDVDPEEEKDMSLAEKLNRVIAKSTQQSNNQPTQRVPLTQDFKLFEATKKRTERLEKLFQALLTTKPTSVESERAFSAGGSFCTKIRSRMNDDTLSALVSLKQYFKHRELKQCYLE